MKKLLSSVLVLSLFCVLLSSCGGNDDNLISKEITLSSKKSQLMDKLTFYREIATYHSNGLRYVLPRLNSEKTTRLSMDSKENFDLKLNDLVLDYVTKEKLDTKFKSIITRADIDHVDDSGNHLTKDEPIPVSSLRKDYVNYFSYITGAIVDTLDTSSLSDNVTNLVQSFEYDDFYNSLSEQDQNAFMMYIAVYEDSFNYWSENFDLGDNDTAMTRGFWRRFRHCWHVFTTVVVSDAIGGFAGYVDGLDPHKKNCSLFGAIKIGVSTSCETYMTRFGREKDEVVISPTPEKSVDYLIIHGDTIPLSVTEKIFIPEKYSEGYSENLLNL